MEVRKTALGMHPSPLEVEATDIISLLFFNAPKADYPLYRFSPWILTFEAFKEVRAPTDEASSAILVFSVAS